MEILDQIIESERKHRQRVDRIDRRIPREEKKKIDRMGKTGNLMHYAHVFLEKFMFYFIVCLTIAFPVKPMFIMLGIFILGIVLKSGETIAEIVARRMTKKQVEIAEAAIAKEDAENANQGQQQKTEGTGTSVSSARVSDN